MARSQSGPLQIGSRSALEHQQADCRTNVRQRQAADAGHARGHLQPLERETAADDVFDGGDDEMGETNVKGS